MVGGGRACHELLSRIQDEPNGLGLTVVGVADPNPDAPGAALARHMGVELVVTDFHELLARDDIDLVVELTGLPEISDEIACALPDRVHFIDHYAAWFFWDFFAVADQRIRSERNRLQNILDSLPYEIMVIDKEHVVEQANRTFLENNELELAQVLGKQCYDLIYKTRRPCETGHDVCLHEETLRHGKPVSRVLSTTSEDGTERFTAVRTALMRDEEGNIQGVVEALRDITQRVQTEEMLKETRGRLDQFIDIAPLFIYMKNANLEYRVINRHALEALGLTETDVVGKTDFALFPAKIARQIQVREREVLRTGKTIHAEGALPLPDHRMDFSATLLPVRKGDQVVGLFGLIEDTTELHKSEEELHREQERLLETRKYLAGILENSRDMIFLTDPEGNLLSFNKGAEEVLGRRSQDVLGRHVAEFAVDEPAFRELFTEAVRDGHSEAFEVHFHQDSGDSAVCNVSLTRINAPDGSPLEVVGICRNITKRLRLRDDLIRAERLAAIGKMAAGVAHEINNPLAVIETIGGVIEDTIDEEKEALAPENRALLDRAVERLHHQIRRCTNITHSLLGFVHKSDTGGQEVAVSEVLDEALNLLAPEINRSRMEIRRNYAADLPRPATDPVMLEQVLVNLIKNAIDAVEEAMDRQGLIEIGAAEVGGAVEVTIVDNGVGIPEAARDKIFDLFHTSKPVGKGTGLGLAIVHDIAEQLGYGISFETEEGKGTTFSLRIPIAQGS